MSNIKRTFNFRYLKSEQHVTISVIARPKLTSEKTSQLACKWNIEIFHKSQTHFLPTFSTIWLFISLNLNSCQSSALMCFSTPIKLISYASNAFLINACVIFNKNFHVWHGLIAKHVFIYLFCCNELIPLIRIFGKVSNINCEWSNWADRFLFTNWWYLALKVSFIYIYSWSYSECLFT